MFFICIERDCVFTWEIMLCSLCVFKLGVLLQAILCYVLYVY